MDWLAWAQRIERILDRISAGLLAAIVCCLALQVFCRYLLQWSPNWTEEVARFLLIWMTMLASAAALRSGGHIAVDALLSGVQGRLRLALLALRDVAVLATVGLLAWAGWSFAATNAGQESPALEISMAVPYAALTVGALLMALQLALARLGGQTIALAQGADGSL